MSDLYIIQDTRPKQELYPGIGLGHFLPLLGKRGSGGPARGLLRVLGGPNIRFWISIDPGTLMSLFHPLPGVCLPLPLPHLVPGFTHLDQGYQPRLPKSQVELFLVLVPILARSFSAS